MDDKTAEALALFDLYDTLEKVLLGVFLCLVFAGVVAAFATLGGCTAEQGALAKQETTAIGAKVQQCLTQALADEIGSIVLAHTIMATQPMAPVAQPQTILVPVLPSMPHEPVDTNARDAGVM